MKNSKMTVVIHTEEEFNWENGFYRSNNKVTHGKELIAFCEKILETNSKLIMAMNYAFIMSKDGQKVIDHFKQKKHPNFEFASHLHPWVNPPFENKLDKVEDIYSFPGNLSSELEQKKLEALTDQIEEKTGTRPTTYLAGRYGVGNNSYKVLRKLGYKKDLSISPFADFSDQKGPNFSKYNNSIVIKENITCIPHSSGYISRVKILSNYLNKSHKHLAIWNSSILGKIFLKLLGVKRVRLSPEGYTLKEQLKLYESLKAINVEELIYSLHSPSLIIGSTPYVTNKTDLKALQKSCLAFLNITQKSKISPT